MYDIKVLLLRIKDPYKTEYVNTGLLKQLISVATSVVSRLHERFFRCAAAVPKNDCVSATLATASAAGTLQETCS